MKTRFAPVGAPVATLGAVRLGLRLGRWMVALVTGAAVGACAAGAPTRAAGLGPLAAGLTGDALDRAAVLAFPSVYGVESAPIPRIAGSRRQRPERRQGIAVAVAPSGWLVTAWHVIDPQDDSPVPRRILVRQAISPAGGPRQSWVARVVAQDPDLDLALLRIAAPGAPALRLAESPEAPTRVATFTRDSGNQIVARQTRTGDVVFNQELELRVSLLADQVPRGDSGGPAVDRDGRVRGIVLGSLSRKGYADTAADVRRFLSRANLPRDGDDAASSFAAGMDALWHLRPSEAEALLQATERAFPHHTHAGRALADADALRSARYRLAGPRAGRGLLLAGGVMSGVIAVALAATLAWRRPAPEAGEAEGVPEPPG
jgi:hypothetical protein